MLQRAQVWKATNIAAMNLQTGPTGPGTFARGQTVPCCYVQREMNGRSPKFMCVIPGRTPDEVKVKYGTDNAEVYGEVMATRLLWALGFGADRMYPVQVICKGCPETIEATSTLPSGEKVFDPAVIERKAAGWEIAARSNEGWSWPELGKVDPAKGGAPLAHRDALRLLAVMIQHSDSKADQQRLICLDGPYAAAPRPAAMRAAVHDDSGRRPDVRQDRLLLSQGQLRQPRTLGQRHGLRRTTRAAWATSGRRSWARWKARSSARQAAHSSRTCSDKLTRHAAPGPVRRGPCRAAIGVTRTVTSGHPRAWTTGWQPSRQKRQEIADRRCPAPTVRQLRSRPSSSFSLRLFLSFRPCLSCPSRPCLCLVLSRVLRAFLAALPAASTCSQSASKTDAICLASFGLRTISRPRGADRARAREDSGCRRRPRGRRGRWRARAGEATAASPTRRPLPRMVTLPITRTSTPFFARSLQAAATSGRR